MWRRRDHIIERFEAWWKIANKSLGLFVENVENDRCVGSIFGNQLEFLLMDGALRTVVRSYRLDVGSDTELRIKVKELLFDDAYLSKVVDDKKSWFT